MGRQMAALSSIPPLGLYIPPCTAKFPFFTAVHPPCTAGLICRKIEAAL